MIRALGVGPSIIVGHSLGGLTALLINDRHPDLVLGIVLGDSPLKAAAAGTWPRRVEAIRAAGSMEFVRATVESFFVDSTPPEVAEHARSVMLSCDASVGAGMLDNGGVFVERLDELIRNADQKPLMAIWAARPLGDPAHLRDIAMFIRQEPVAGAGTLLPVRAASRDERTPPRLPRRRPARPENRRNSRRLSRVSAWSTTGGRVLFCNVRAIVLSPWGG